MKSNLYEKKNIKKYACLLYPDFIKKKIKTKKKDLRVAN